MNDIPGFRRIIKDDGMVSMKELFRSFILGNESQSLQRDDGNVPIDPTKVPITVHPKQFEIINFRRMIRSEIEGSRIRAGRPINGRRQRKFKYVSKHLQASRRVRNPNGSFTVVQLEEEHVHSIAN